MRKREKKRIINKKVPLFKQAIAQYILSLEMIIYAS